MAKPKTKRLTPREISSLLVLNSATRTLADPEYAEDVRVMARTDKVTTDVMNHFLGEEKFLDNYHVNQCGTANADFVSVGCILTYMGFCTSSGSHSTTKGSSIVPFPW